MSYTSLVSILNGNVLKHTYRLQENPYETNNPLLAFICEIETKTFEFSGRVALKTVADKIRHLDCTK